MTVRDERDREQDPAASGGGWTAERERYLFRWNDLPLVTGDLPGTGGVIRTEPDDFQVEELPLYLPEGSGSHLYLLVRKRGLTTRDLVQALVRGGAEESGVGVAGLKDKAAVTTQWLSVPKRQAAAVAELVALPGVAVLEEGTHRNKLGLGHLRGNRFVIRIRDVSPDALDAATAALDALALRGTPNWFGPQRFGRFGGNAYDGLRVLRGERVPGGHRLRRFFVSALQSLLFNAMLAERIRRGWFGTVVLGDWARKHDTGGTFRVDDPATEAPRAARLEISATLPLYGRKVRVSDGDAGALEEAVLDAYGLRWPQFGSRRGDRRSTRVTLANVHVARSEDVVTVAFDLPKGSYATAVLREVMKVDVDEPVVGTGDAGDDPSDDDGDDRGDDDAAD
ncbi:MAG: tRNA pseudouridine(13) synthase TruD [Trueperaceae bacterium]